MIDCVVGCWIVIMSRLLLVRSVDAFIPSKTTPLNCLTPSFWMQRTSFSLCFHVGNSGAVLSAESSFRIASTPPEHTNRCWRRGQHSVRLFASSNTGKSTSQEQHQLYLEQLQELQEERKSLFGIDDSADSSSSNNIDIDNIPHVNQTQIGSSSHTHASSIGTTTGAESTTESPLYNNDDYTNNEMTLQDLKEEREAIYAFTQQEEQAWRMESSRQHNRGSSFLQEINRARRLPETHCTNNNEVKSEVTEMSRSHSPASTSFTHVSADGATVHMVDVGDKKVTRRTAIAESLVYLPPEVLQIFKRDDKNNDLVGSKGPVFSTAILAGIMAAKQTSSLIPLCHPLPLEQVDVQIHWVDASHVRIVCTCKVTHKTGVEMEALTGANVAALTLYDMVKAASHKVEIVKTRLVFKEGGKRSIHNDN